MSNLEPITPAAAIELYIDDRSNELAAETIRSHRSRLSHFIEWTGEEGIEDMNDVTGRRLHEYRVWRRDRGEANTVTMKSAMDTLRVFIRWCESIDAVPADTAEKVLSPSLSPGDNERDEMLDPEVGDSILEYLDRYKYASREHVVMLLIWRGLLRRGGIRAIDLEDLSIEPDEDDPRIRIRHRPDTDTPLKNQNDGERTIGIKPATAQVLRDYRDEHRHDVTDGSREPLLTTRSGRPHAQTIQADAYAATRPCKAGAECPHGRDPETCDAARDRQQAYECPSSTPPHDVRRGAITRWLKADIPDTVVGSRCNTNPSTLDKHYDQRSERQKQRQRRRYLDRV
jgi:site-specific recombinase XerD